MRKQLIIRGFYGNGNCGDEALLQTLFDYFSPQYDITVSVNDPQGVKDRLNKKGIAPYADVSVISNLNRGALASDAVVGYFLGGGGLGLGLGWDQYMFAWLNGKKIIHSGVHITGEYMSPRPGFNEVTKGFLEAADYLSVRHYHSQKVAESLGVSAEYLPDWAFALRPKIGPHPNRNYIVLTVRSDTNNENPHTRRYVESIEAYAKAEGLEVVILPFDGGDDRVSKSLDVQGDIYSGYYYQPAYVKYLISRATAVFSIGRYHPIVFGLASDVPVFSVDTVREGRSDDKTCLQLVEEGLGDFHFPLNRVDEFVPGKIAELVNRFGTSGAYPKDFLDHKTRLDAAANTILGILAA